MRMFGRRRKQEKSALQPYRKFNGKKLYPIAFDTSQYKMKAIARQCRRQGYPARTVWVGGDWVVYTSRNVKLSEK